MIDYVLWWIALWLLQAWLLEREGAPQLRWAQGWLIPHAERRANCRVQCVTCRRG